MVNELDDLMQSRASYLNHKLLTVPVSRKQQRTSYNRSLENTLSRPASSNERGTAERQSNELCPITLSSTSPRARGLGTRQPSVFHLVLSESSAEPSRSRRTAVLVINFCIFTVQQRCKHLSCLLFTCAYQLSVYLH